MRRFLFVLAILFGFASVSFGAEVVVTRAPGTKNTASRPILPEQWNILAEFDIMSFGADRSAHAITLAVMDLENFGLAASAADEISIVRIFADDVFVAEVPVALLSGLIFFNDVNIGLPADTRVRLTVMGLVNSIADGADSGASVYAHFREIEIRGKAETFVVSAESVVGNRMVVYKSLPRIWVSSPDTKLFAGQISVIEFNLGPDYLPNPIAWKKITFQIAPVGCDIAPIDASPGFRGNVALYVPEFGTKLDIASATGAENGIANGTTGFVSLVLRNEEVVAGFSVKRYRLEIPVRNTSPVAGASYVSVRLALTETYPFGPGLQFVPVASEASFVWSDMSDIRHSEESPDWHNGYLVPGLPSDFVTIGGELGGMPPPPPPSTRWERFEFPRNEWIFFAPVGEPFDSEFPPANRWGWNAEAQTWARDGFHGTGMSARAERELEGAIGPLSVSLLTTERPEEEVRLLPGWNLIGFTRFPGADKPQEIGLWEIPSREQGVVQAAVWSPTQRRYLRVGVRADGMYWYDGDTSSPEFLVRPGSAFFVYHLGNSALFNPNKAFLFLKGAPSMNLNNSGGTTDDGNVVPPPPLPVRTDPRGKKLETWGEMKRR